MSAADPLAPGASQQDYWQVLESYERHLAAKRQKTQSWKSHLPAAERHIPTTVEEQLQVIEPAEAAPAVLDRPDTLVEAALGPEARMVAPQAAAATSTAAAPAAPAPLEDVADVSTDEEAFVDDSEDEDEEAPAGPHAAPPAEPAGAHAGSAELLQGLTEALLRTIKSLATDLSARFPNDALVARMKKRIHLAADIWPQALIDGVGEGLYEYRDRIYSADASFFLESSFEKERARIDGNDVEKMAETYAGNVNA